MPAVSIALRVNGSSIELDKFTQSFIRSTVLGMLSTLRGMEDAAGIEKVQITICGENASVMADGVEIGMNTFIRDFVRNTLKAMVAPLRGVACGVQDMDLVLLLPLTT